MTKDITSSVLTDSRFNRIKERLVLDPLDLDTEVVEHPGLLFEVSEAHGLALSKRDGARDKVKRALAELRPVAKKLLEKSKEKPTVAAIDAAVESDGEYLEAVDHANEATYQARRWEALRDAVQARGYAIREVVNLYCVRFGSEGTASYREPRQGSKDAYREKKAKLNQQRTT